jgi:hypothetical protein
MLLGSRVGDRSRPIKILSWGDSLARTLTTNRFGTLLHLNADLATDCGVGASSQIATEPFWPGWPLLLRFIPSASLSTRRSIQQALERKVVQVFGDSDDLCGAAADMRHIRSMTAGPMPRTATIETSRRRLGLFVTALCVKFVARSSVPRTSLDKELSLKNLEGWRRGWDSHHCCVLETKNLRDSAFLRIRKIRSNAWIETRIEHAEICEQTTSCQNTLEVCLEDGSFDRL